MVTLASFFTILYRPFKLSAVMAAAQQRHNNSKKKDNFSLFVLKKKREKLSLFFSFLLLFCLVLCRGSLRSGYMSTEIFFFLSFVEENPIKEKEQQQNRTDVAVCCDTNSSHFQLIHEMSFPYFSFFSNPLT